MLTEVRSLVNRVRVDPVDLRETLRALAEGAVGLRVELSVPEDLGALDPARADAITRCAQEAITNTLRHAKATQIDIQVEQAVDGELRIAVRDDGCGGRFVEGAASPACASASRCWAGNSPSVALRVGDFSFVARSPR